MHNSFLSYTRITLHCQLLYYTELQNLEASMREACVKNLHNCTFLPDRKASKPEQACMPCHARRIIRVEAGGAVKEEAGRQNSPWSAVVIRQLRQEIVEGHSVSARLYGRSGMTFAEKSGFDWKVKSGGIEKKSWNWRWPMDRKQEITRHPSLLHWKLNSSRKNGRK